MIASLLEQKLATEHGVPTRELEIRTLRPSRAYRQRDRTIMEGVHGNQARPGCPMHTRNGKAEGHMEHNAHDTQEPAARLHPDNYWDRYYESLRAEQDAIRSMRCYVAASEEYN